MADTPTDDGAPDSAASQDPETTVTDRTAATGTLAGQVTDTDGNAIPDTIVSVSQPGFAVTDTTTDSNGNYSIELQPDDYGVYADKVGYEPENQQNVTIESETTTRVDFTLSAALRKVIGEVTNSGDMGMVARNTAGSGWNYGLLATVEADSLPGGREPSAAIRARATGRSSGIITSAVDEPALRAETTQKNVSRVTAIQATVTDPGSRALFAESAADSRSGIGIIGKTNTKDYQGLGFPKAAGVLGEATASTGSARGVTGRTYSRDGYGVFSDGQLAVERSVAYDGDFRRHAATIENTSGDSNGDILGLKTQVTDPGTNMNYISFVDDNGQVGQIQGDGNGGVEFVGSLADFAEFFPKRDPDRTFEGGEVVGLRDGAVVPADDGADLPMVVSSRPIVTGNKPLQEDRAEYVKLSLVGQVPVQVSSPVASGDRLVPSPDDDGTAVARPETERDDQPVLGIALEDHDPAVGDDAATDHTVLALVGPPDGRVNGALARQVQRQQAVIDRLEAEREHDRDRLEDLERENRALRERLAAVEERLATVENAAGNGPTPADD